MRIIVFGAVTGDGLAEVQVLPEDDIRQLKQKICSIVGVFWLKLIFNDRILIDTETIVTSGLSDSSKVAAVIVEGPPQDDEFAQWLGNASPCTVDDLGPECVFEYKRFEQTVMLQGQSKLTFKRCLFGAAGSEVNLALLGPKVHLEECCIRGSSDVGLLAAEGANVYLHRCVIEDCVGQAICLHCAASVTARNCVIRTCGAVFSSSVEPGCEQSTLDVQECHIEGIYTMRVCQDWPGTLLLQNNH